MSWGLGLNGGPYHVGHCPKCDRRTGTCHDELCPDCFDEEPVQCPDCLEYVQPDQMHGAICNECFELQEEEKINIMTEIYQP